jgi:hypothetical protein
MEFVYDDGGSGHSNLHDCVPRSIAIAAQLDYDEVYERFVELTSNVIYEDGSTYAERLGYYPDDDVIPEAGVPTEGERGLPNRTRLHMASMRSRRRPSADNRAADRGNAGTLHLSYRRRNSRHLGLPRPTSRRLLGTRRCLKIAG